MKERRATVPLASVNVGEPVGYDPRVYRVRILTTFIRQVRLDFRLCQIEVVLSDQYPRREKMAQPICSVSLLEASKSFVSEFVLMNENGA